MMMFLDFRLLVCVTLLQLANNLLKGILAALLTKYKGPEMEKPVIRPYTPTSDEGMSFLLSTADLYQSRHQLLADTST